MKIGPRTDELESKYHYCWTREINGIRFRFVHVKITRLERPYISVSRAGIEIRCSCPRDDCPFAT